MNLLKDRLNTDTRFQNRKIILHMNNLHKSNNYPDTKFYLSLTCTHKPK